MVVDEVMRIYCEEKRADIFEWDCDKWTCPQWVGNGGTCVPTRHLKRDLEEEFEED